MIPLQQFCDPTKGFMEHMLDFEFWAAIGCQYAEPVGFYVFGLIVYTGVALPIYIRTNSITVPAVLLLIIGGVVMPQIAGVATPIARFLIVMSFAGSFVLLYYKFGR